MRKRPEVVWNAGVAAALNFCEPKRRIVDHPSIASSAVRSGDLGKNPKQASFSLLSSMVGAVSTCVVAAGAAGALSPRPPSGIVIVQSNRVFICTVADVALPACAFDGSRLSSLDRPLA